MLATRLVPLALLLALGAVPAAAVPNACKKSCRTARTACLVPVTATFVAARTACRALATPALRRPCLATARGTRATGQAACRTTLKQCTAGCGTGGTPGCRSHQADWPSTVNAYRALANLPPVIEHPDWDAGVMAHATYTVVENTIGHTENPASPAYTADGATAAANSNVAGYSTPTPGFGWAVDLWMTGPFHAIGIIDPLLAESAFGIAHDTTGSIQTGAVLDVIRGRTATAGPGTFPVIYPGDGMVLPLDRYNGNELPDPLAPCPGYSQPSGPPILVQFGSFTPMPVIADVVLARNGTPVEACAYDGDTYTTTDPATQATARNVLGSRAALVIMPRAVFTAGATYQVSLTAGGQPLAWSFTVACSP